MSVFREAEIEWRGKKYKFVPSMALLRSIEFQGISLMHVEWQVAKGQPQAALMSTIVALCLASAGVPDADDEVIYQELRSSNPKDVMRLYMALMNAISPVEKAEKKEEAQAA